MEAHGRGGRSMIQDSVLIDGDGIARSHYGANELEVEVEAAVTQDPPVNGVYCTVCLGTRNKCCL